MLKIEYSLDQIQSVAKQIIKATSSKIILFDAEMGMGKTTLIKALVKALGCNDDVSSPTFSLVNEYKGKKDTIYHFDLYRIEHEEELYNFGFEDYLNSNAWIFIEWPQIAKRLLPTAHSVLNITEISQTERALKLSVIE